ncbi:MAG: RHS repeat-associated core domain-containing protein [Nanoarchaeota archaeon]
MKILLPTFVLLLLLTVGMAVAKPAIQQIQIVPGGEVMNEEPTPDDAQAPEDTLNQTEPTLDHIFTGNQTIDHPPVGLVLINDTNASDMSGSDAIEFRQMPVIRLTNLERSAKVNLKEYIGDYKGPIDWTVSGQGVIEAQIKGNNLFVSYQGDDPSAAEWIQVQATAKGEIIASQEVRVTYIDIDEETAPTAVDMSDPDLLGSGIYDTSSFMAGAYTTRIIDMDAGWNLISIPVVPDNASIPSILEDIEPFYDAVYAYTYDRYANEWQAYIPGTGIETLQAVDNSMGIWVHMTWPAQLEVHGNEVLQVEIVLNQGWNLVAYPGIDGARPSDVFSNVLDHIHTVYEYDLGFPGLWKTYSPQMLPFLVTLQSMESGKGYMVYAKQPMTVEFNAADNTYILLHLDNNQRYDSKSYVNLNGAAIAQIDEEGNRNYYHADLMRNTRILTDDQGDVVWSQEYYPFGEQGPSDGTGNSVKFGEKEYDYDTRMYYYGARYYDPSIGRFIQADTFDGVKTDTQSLNRYSYAANNPLMYTDPSGNSKQKADEAPRLVYYYSPKQGSGTNPGQPNSFGRGYAIANGANEIARNVLILYFPMTHWMDDVNSQQGVINQQSRMGYFSRVRSLYTGASNFPPSIGSVQPASSGLFDAITARDVVAALIAGGQELTDVDAVTKVLHGDDGVSVQSGEVTQFKTWAMPIIKYVKGNKVGFTTYFGSGTIEEIDLDSITLTPEQRQAIERAKERFYSDDKSEAEKKQADKDAKAQAQARNDKNSREQERIDATPGQMASVDDSQGIIHSPYVGRGPIE